MDLAKAGLGVEVHTRPRGAHDWRETPASEALDARTLKAAAQACPVSPAQLFRPSTHMLPLPGIQQSPVCSIMSPLLDLLYLQPLETALARVS